MSRYDLGTPKDEHEPGSGGAVLRNRIGLKNPAEVDRRETVLLSLAVARSFGRVEPTTRLTVDLLRELHRSWLGSLYTFAGEIRTVDMSKGAVRFAPVAYLANSLRDLDTVLANETPCHGMEGDRLVEAIARVHVEILLVHPFREGNGRLARWVADLMALQAGRPPLDWAFDVETDARRDADFAALRRGFALDFTPLGNQVRAALTRAAR